MVELNANEKDLLARVDQNEKLRPLFFQKVVGIKWFYPLYKKGYFLPSSNPMPKPSEEEGYVNIPHWAELDYLVRTAPELAELENNEIALKVLELLSEITEYASQKKFSNYRTYWQLSQILYFIPIELVKPESLSMLDIWLKDQYQQSLVYTQLSEKWAIKLLEINTEHSLMLAQLVLSKLMTINFKKRGNNIGRNSKAVVFLVDSYHAKKAIGKLSFLSGQRIGKQAVDVFHENLINLLRKLKNDAWSCVWHPAIEDHPQNKYRDDAEHLTIAGYRDSMRGFLEAFPDEAQKHIRKMLASRYQTVHRIAIYLLDDKYDSLIELHKLINNSKKYLTTNYRHEYWNYLNHHYGNLDTNDKKKVLENIDSLSFEDDEGIKTPSRVAYQKSIWISAIKHADKKILNLYNKQIRISKAEPENPSFSSYTTFGSVTHKSPYSAIELQSLSLNELIEKINSFKQPQDLAFQLPNLQGFTKAINQLIKSAPLNYIDDLQKFSDVDFPFIYEVIEAYKSLWSENPQLPWNEIWPKLLKFCNELVSNKMFWTKNKIDHKGHLIANREWVVTAIARLITVGVQSDDHAFEKKNNKQAKKILSVLLKMQAGEKHDLNSDSVFKAINSPRGNCLEALINLTLRIFRTTAKVDHGLVWVEFEPIYSRELNNVSIYGNEFSALITNYLPNFMFMSREWVLTNLPKIFNQDDRTHWLAAIQGYGYVSNVDPDIYGYLSKTGDFIKALDDPLLKDNIKNVVIDNIVIAYFYEIDKNAIPLIYQIISRNRVSEISHLVWFIWTLRNDANPLLKEKVFEIWEKIFNNLDLELKEHKKIASRLASWTVFIEELDDKKIDLVMKVADLAEYDYNSHDLFIGLANISHKDAMVAMKIWKVLLSKSSPDYPQDSIQIILANAIKTKEGLRAARDITSIYISKGNENPHKWLKEVLAIEAD